MPIADNEKVYDDQIHPLMAQILTICKAHKIPMLASFVFAPDGFCTSMLGVAALYPEEERSHENVALAKAYRAIKGEPQFVALTITTAPSPADEKGPVKP